MCLHKRYTNWHIKKAGVATPVFFACHNGHSYHFAYSQYSISTKTIQAATDFCSVSAGVDRRDRPASRQIPEIDMKPKIFLYLSFWYQKDFLPNLFSLKNILTLVRI
jgi:hypothetical protein